VIKGRQTMRASEDRHRSDVWPVVDVWTRPVPDTVTHSGRSYRTVSLPCSRFSKTGRPNLHCVSKTFPAL